MTWMDLGSEVCTEISLFISGFVQPGFNYNFAVLLSKEPNAINIVKFCSIILSNFLFSNCHEDFSRSSS